MYASVHSFQIKVLVNVLCLEKHSITTEFDQGQCGGLCARAQPLLSSCRGGGLKNQSGLYQELFKVLKFQEAFVVSLSKDHCKNPHVIQAMDVIDAAHATAGQHF